MITLAKFFTALLVAGGSTFVSLAQDPQPKSLDANVSNDKKRSDKDSLKHILHSKGTFEGHIRNFFMTTTNQGDYPDYYAWGLGGGLGYYSPVIKGFQAGLSGFIIYNLSSTPLAPAPPFSNRYEIGLFDLTDPDNHQVLNRLEDLYLRYYLTRKNKSFIQVGKFHLKTPMVNLQDGRMRPNLQEGIWAEWNDSEKIKVKGGWIWRTSPRSTIHWYAIGQSLVYPNGRAINGAKATYSEHTQSDGMAIANVTWKPVKPIDYQIWNYYVDRLFNLSFHKIEFKRKSGSRTFMAGFQYAWQHSIYHDTLSIEKQYITAGEQSHTFSGRLGVNDRGKEWNLNYTRITRHGRFLFPREWGIEPFYTFMQRERNEGAGDVHAASLQHTRYLDKARQWEFMGGAGMFWMPSVIDARLNKYAMPSYYQLNARSRYRFNGFLQGLSLEVLYVYKGNLAGEIEEKPLYIHNKVNMHNLSVVMDYFF